MGITSKQVAAQARDAGYEVVTIEQLRANRWLMELRDPQGASYIVLAQQRPLLSAADVEYLADFLRLHQAKEGILLAIGGDFSAVARSNALEMRDMRVHLYTSLPDVHLPQNPSTALSSAS